MGAAERGNGHSHGRAVLLCTSASLNVIGGEIDLGRWQRILFAEFDGPQERSVSLLILGTSGAGARPLPPRPVRPDARAPRASFGITTGTPAAAVSSDGSASG